MGQPNTSTPQSYCCQKLAETFLLFARAGYPEIGQSHRRISLPQKGLQQCLCQSTIHMDVRIRFSCRTLHKSFCDIIKKKKANQTSPFFPLLRGPVLMVMWVFSMAGRGQLGHPVMVCSCRPFIQKIAMHCIFRHLFLYYLICLIRPPLLLSAPASLDHLDHRQFTTVSSLDHF